MTSPIWKPEHQPQTKEGRVVKQVDGGPEVKKKKRWWWWGGGEGEGSYPGESAKTHLQTGPGGSDVLHRQTAVRVSLTQETWCCRKPEGLASVSSQLSSNTPPTPYPRHASPLQLTPYFSLQALVYNNPPSRRLTALPRSESQTGSVFISLA